MSRIEIMLLDRKNPYCVIDETFRYVITNMRENLG
mgnify:FL=1